MLCIVLLFLFPTVTAELGLDAIDPISVGTFQCLKKSGYDFYIGRVWESVGNYDYQGMQNMKNAKAGGLTYVDGYIFPCLNPACAHAANQKKNEDDSFRWRLLSIKFVHQEHQWEHCGWILRDWPADKNYNRNFITAMANQAASMGVTVGIYTNYYNWQEIVGLDWTAMSKYPLWWATYNGHQDFTGFGPFGGWSKPNIHQYTGDVQGGCGVNMDQNWYPG